MTKQIGRTGLALALLLLTACAAPKRLSEDAASFGSAAVGLAEADRDRLATASADDRARLRTLSMRALRGWHRAQGAVGSAAFGSGEARLHVRSTWLVPPDEFKWAKMCQVHEWWIDARRGAPMETEGVACVIGSGRLAYLERPEKVRRANAGRWERRWSVHEEPIEPAMFAVLAPLRVEPLGEKVSARAVLTGQVGHTLALERPQVRPGDPVADSMTLGADGGFRSTDEAVTVEGRWRFCQDELCVAVGDDWMHIEVWREPGTEVYHLFETETGRYFGLLRPPHAASS